MPAQGVFTTLGDSHSLLVASQAQDFPPFLEKEDAAWRKAAAIWESGGSHPPGLSKTHSLRVLQLQDAYPSSIKAI